jgi:hypothetical protein
LLGRCRFHGNQLGPKRRWQFLYDVFPTRHELGSLLDQLIGPKAGGLGGVARYAKYLPAEFHSQARRDQRSRILRAFHDHNPERHPRYDPVPNREVLRRRKRSQREFADDRAALLHVGKNLLVLLGVDDIDTAAENADRRSPAALNAPL